MSKNKIPELSLKNPTLALSFILEDYPKEFFAFLQSPFDPSKQTKSRIKFATDLVCEMISDETGLSLTEAQNKINLCTQEGIQNFYCVLFYVETIID